MVGPPLSTDKADAIMRRPSRTLPKDVELLPWLAEQLGISKATAYRQAKAGELERWGVFQIGSQYRVSLVRFFRAKYGDDGTQMLADAWASDAQVSS
jgi:hypothetical protein